MNIREELRFLRRCGTRIDQGLSDVDLMIGAWLKVRDKQGRLIALAPNRVQREFGRKCGKRNIVLKARQLGMTTYVAARFFVSTITRPGTLSVQVAHDQQSAEEIFGIVHRFLANLPARSGNDKKEAALSFLGSALSITEAIGNRDIVDEEKFKDGMGKIIDGVVQCLNASAWAKGR